MVVHISLITIDALDCEMSNTPHVEKEAERDVTSEISKKREG